MKKEKEIKKDGEVITEKKKRPLLTVFVIAVAAYGIGYLIYVFINC